MATDTQALTEQLALVGVGNPQLADNANVDTAWIDMSKFRRAAFLLMTGAMDITVDFKLRYADDDSGTNAADISGKAITQLADTQDNKQAWIEIRDDEMAALASGVGKRYVSARAVVGNGTTGAYVAIAALAAPARYEPASAYDLVSVVEIKR